MRRGQSHTPEVRARMSAASKAALARKRPWLAAMTPEQRADYDTLRRAKYSVDEALAAMGMTR